MICRSFSLERKGFGIGDETIPEGAENTKSREPVKAIFLQPTRAGSIRLAPARAMLNNFAA
jgi:hypothetical protein